MRLSSMAGEEPWIMDGACVVMSTTLESNGSSMPGSVTTALTRTLTVALTAARQYTYTPESTVTVSIDTVITQFKPNGPTECFVTVSYTGDRSDNMDTAAGDVSAKAQTAIQQVMTQHNRDMPSIIINCPRGPITTNRS